ncbi:MAG: glycosyltransferase family 1 protein [Chloroflexota bacterium]
MRIAIDASRTTRAHLTGTERYALELIRALIRLNDTLDDPHHLFLYFNEPPARNLFQKSRHVAKVVIPMQRLWTQFRFATELYKHPPDVTWVPAHGLPFVFPGRSVVTVHDLGYRFFPAAHPWRQRVALEVYTGYSANRATVVMADSKATRNDLCGMYSINPDKVRVVYPGVKPLHTHDISEVRRKYHIPSRYWLYIGTLQPRKNIARIVDAFHMWKARQNEDDKTALVLAGGKGWKFDDRWVQGASVLLPGYIDEEDKGTLYSGAIALLFPSLYEGFGFPVVEAMGVGTPVICSDTSSLPELGGQAVLYVPPQDMTKIADQMTRLTSDPRLRASLGRRGKVQAKKFTWEDAAWDALLALENAGRHRSVSRVKQR